MIRGRNASPTERQVFQLKLKYDHWCELPQVERLRPYFQKQPESPMAMAWRGEPDSQYFRYGGIECLLLRNPNWCWEGYVLLPQYYMASQPHYRGTVSAFSVHGGVTRWKRQEGYVMIGFDTSHFEPPFTAGPKGLAGLAGPVAPLGFTTSFLGPDFFPASMDKFSVRPTKVETYRTLDYCCQQVCKLADQVAALGIVERPSRLRQPRRWRWERGAPIFPGCTLDRSGKLTLDLAANVGTADVVALLRDWFVVRHQTTGATRDIKAVRLLANFLNECYDMQDERERTQSDLYESLLGEAVLPPLAEDAVVLDDVSTPPSL